MTDTPEVKAVENVAHDHLASLLIWLKNEFEKLGLKIEEEVKKL